MQFPQGYAPQQAQQAAPAIAAQRQQTEQLVKFYKSGLFLIASAAGRFQRDCERMQAQGWRLAFAAPLGVNILLRRVIVATYERAL